MGRIRVGPARVPDRADPARAIDMVLEAGFDALELDLAGGFWMKKDYARAIGDAARANDVALSVHAPIAAFLGHLDRGGKHKRATGMLDHASGLAMLAGAELVVMHPGFYLERTREDAIAAVIEQLAELRERLVAKDRTVAFGIEVMGRVRDLGSETDVLEITSALRPWARPVLDFAHLHAVTDGAFLETEDFAAVLERADAVLGLAAPFHIHFSDIAYANRNETKHLPYGEGTLRADPLADALSTFDRDATVISESPDAESHARIRDLLLA